MEYISNHYVSITLNLTKLKKTSRPFLFFVLFFASGTLAAQQQAATTKPVHLLLEAALELGGDAVAEVYFTNGNTQSVNAGQGGSVAAGVQIQFPKLDKFLLRSTLGIKYVTTAADNAHIRLTRVPIHLTANWMIAKKLRLGGGIATHRAIKFHAGGLGQNIKFRGATGPMLELAYGGVGLRYTIMKYTDEYNNTYSANAIGLSFSLTVPNK
jgi:hypothetical protein